MTDATECRVPQVGVLADLCSCGDQAAQVSEYRDLWHPARGTILKSALIPANSGWVFQQANGFNNSGQIAGYGTIGAQTHAFLLTPTPEPTNLSLIALASIPLLVRRRRLLAVSPE